MNHLELSVNHGFSRFVVSHRHPVDEDRAAVRCLEDGFQDMSALEIPLLGAKLALGHELESSALVIVQDRTEMAGRIDVRETAPVD